MKIVYCASQLYRAGGTEKVLAEKVNYLVKNTNFEIHIITEDQKGNPFCFDIDRRIIVHDMNVSNMNTFVIPGVTFIYNIFQLRRKFSKLLSLINPDIVVVVERGYLDFVIPFIFKKCIKIREFHFSKEAVAIHTKLLERKIDRIRHKIRYKILFQLFNKYNYLVLLTHRDEITGNYKTNTKVICNMLESKPEDISKLTEFNVISVGSMYDSRKNFVEQIQLWRRISKSHPNWKLNIYGDGKEKINLQKLIIEYNLTDKIILHGNSNEMPLNYMNASVFIFTSQAEGFPMVLIEALSYGLPCISYDIPTGPSDIVKDGINGFLVKNHDIVTLESKLITLLDNFELRQQIGENAKKSSSQYLPVNIMNEWIGFFNQITKKN
jgi:glycosyltransferase involved in cell wall biosynthesis